MKPFFLLLTAFFSCWMASAQKEAPTNDLPGLDSVRQAMAEAPNDAGRYNILKHYLRLPALAHHQKPSALFHELIQLGRKVGRNTSAYAIIDYVSHLNKIKSYDSAYIYAHKMRQEAIRINESSLILGSYNTLGAFFQDQSQLDSALYYYQQAEALLKSSKIFLDHVAVCNNIARVYSAIGSLPLSHANYLNALRYVDSMRAYPTQQDDYMPDHVEAIIRQNLAFIFTELGDFERANQELRRTTQLKQKLEHSYGVGLSTSTLATNFALLAEKEPLRQDVLFDSVGKYMEISRIYFQKLGQPDPMLKTQLRNLKRLEGMMLYGKAKYKEAIQVYQNALINSEDEDFKDVNYMLLLTDLSACYASSGQYKQAQMYAEKALNNYNKYTPDEIIQLAGIYKKLAQAEKGLGNYRQALVYQEKMQVYADSNLTESKANALILAEIEFQTEKKEAQLALQESEIARQDAEILQKNAENRAWIIGAGLLLLIGLIALFAYRRQRVLSTQLTSQKAEIEAQNQEISQTLREKEALMREIHHRVKNNLQVVSSLLQLQAFSAANAQAEEQLIESRSRITSMALIHQKLYQTEDLSQIDLKEYLEQLAQEIAVTYRSPQRDIKTLIDSQHIVMDIDTAIPLGLIITELLTNAYKYAYASDQSGEIRLTLRPTEQAGHYQLLVSDDGQGMPVDFDITQSKSLGMRLVNLLSRQIEGEVNWRSEKGTTFIIDFANQDIRKQVA